MLENVITVFLIFGGIPTMIVLLVWIKNKERMKRYELQADLYAKALEKGEKLPDDFFDRNYSIRIEKERKETEKEELAELKRNALNVGLILMFAGIGLSLCLWFGAFFIDQMFTIKMDFPTYVRAASAIGIIPFLIGVAFMIIHFLEKKKDS